MSNTNLMIESVGKDRYLTVATPNINRQLTVSERCSLCSTDIPEGRRCLRHTVTDNPICVACMVMIKFLR